MRLGFASYDPDKLLGDMGMSLSSIAGMLMAAGEGRYSGHMLLQLSSFDHAATVHDVIFAEGHAAVDIADFAAREGVPVVRFAQWDEEVFPAHESPVLIVHTAPQCTRAYVPSPHFLPQGPASTAEAAAASVAATAAESAHRTAAEAGPLGGCTDWAPYTLQGVPRLRLHGPEDIAALAAAVADVHRKATTSPAPKFADVLSDNRAAEEQPPPPLGLTMIVKNEADFIRQTLLSIKPHIDFWTIVDTGSTDDTERIVLETMAGVSGQLRHSEFVDFAQARNVALAAHNASTAYAVMVDGDHTLEHAWRLRLACQRLARECLHRSITACSQPLTISKLYGSSSHLWLRGFPTHGLGTNEGWHYVYPIHEVPENKLTLYQGRPSISVRVVEEAFIPAAGQRSFEKSRQRWEQKDLPLLRQHREKTPNDTRIAFYLAQTLFALARHAEAEEAYEERIQMGGWHEEIYESRMKQAICASSLANSPLPALQAAHQTMPWRAEPLYEMAKWHDGQIANCTGAAACEAQHHLSAYMYAKQAMELAMPTNDMLFVDSQIYGLTGAAADMTATHAWHVARATKDVFDVGLVTAQRLAQAQPQVPRHRSTVEWFSKLKAGLI